MFSSKDTGKDEKMKAVIFDMDGVIIDSEPLHFESSRMTMGEYGVKLCFEDMKEYVGVSSRETFAVLKRKFGIEDTLEALLKKQAIHEMEVFEEERLEPMRGLVSLLEYLEVRNMKTALASSSRRELIETVLKGLGMVKHFGAVVSGEDVERGKPEPDIFLKAASMLGCKSKNCIVIEDSAQGIQAGLAANMFVYGVHNPNSGYQDLSKAHMQVGSLKDVQAHLDSILLDGYG